MNTLCVYPACKQAGEDLEVIKTKIQNFAEALVVHYTCGHTMRHPVPDHTPEAQGLTVTIEAEGPCLLCKIQPAVRP